MIYSMKNITNYKFIDKHIYQNIAITPFGVVGSTFNIKVTQFTSDNTVVSSWIRSIFIGSILGDGSLDMFGTSKYTWFMLVQAFDNF
jgi:hypothetical protein